MIQLHLFRFFPTRRGNVTDPDAKICIGIKYVLKIKIYVLRITFDNIVNEIKIYFLSEVACFYLTIFIEIVCHQSIYYFNFTGERIRIRSPIFLIGSVVTKYWFAIDKLER